jgi:uncharacterized membrane protein/nitrite reductase/ring-hydroxylating ferredoxin subunit
MRETLQGRLIKHPLHPLLVHFPIGLFSLSLILDAASWLFPDRQALMAGALASMALGVCLALVAAIPGFADYSDIHQRHPAKKTATYHMMLNLVVVTLYATNSVWRFFSIAELESTPLGPFVLALVAYGLLGLSGYLGGQLVYDDGVGVGRHRRRSSAPPEALWLAATKPNAAEPATPADFVFVPVLKSSDLKEGVALRVEAKSHTLTCVRDGGEIFAVQEYCTHRFGPLSEGRVEDGRIVCPWHRSCFELRSGQVTQGPAKVPLKVYPTQLRDGMLYVGIPSSKGSQALPDAS